MFDFLSMLGTQKERLVKRLVGHYDDGTELIVDTYLVSGSEQPYETAISDVRYNSGDWVVVECYGLKEEAKEAHDRWAELMVSSDGPDKLVDVSTCEVSVLRDELEGTGWRGKPRKQKEVADET